MAAATKVLQSPLSWVRCSASTNDGIPLVLQISLMHWFQRLGGLPCGLDPCMRPSNTNFGYLLPSILATCPKYVSCFWLILSSMDRLRPRVFLMNSFLNLSLRLTPIIRLRQDISNVLSLFMSRALRVQVSVLYRMIDNTSV